MVMLLRHGLFDGEPVCADCASYRQPTHLRFNMIKGDIFLTCIHDRHTDDNYRAFTHLEDAMQYVRDNFIRRAD